MMNQVTCCAKCSSPNVIPKVRVIDHGHGNYAKDLTIELYDNPQALIFKGALTMSLYAWVCGECGFTELYVEPKRTSSSSTQMGIKLVLKMTLFLMRLTKSERDMAQRPASNNGMHPTANSVNVIRETWPYLRCARGG